MDFLITNIYFEFFSFHSNVFFFPLLFSSFFLFFSVSKLKWAFQHSPSLLSLSREREFRFEATKRQKKREKRRREERREEKRKTKKKKRSDVNRNDVEVNDRAQGPRTTTDRIGNTRSDENQHQRKTKRNVTLSTFWDGERKTHWKEKNKCVTFPFGKKKERKKKKSSADSFRRRSVPSCKRARSKLSLPYCCLLLSRDRTSFQFFRAPLPA